MNVIIQIAKQYLDNYKFDYLNDALTHPMRVKKKYLEKDGYDEQEVWVVAFDYMVFQLEMGFVYISTRSNKVLFVSMANGILTPHLDNEDSEESDND